MHLHKMLIKENDINICMVQKAGQPFEEKKKLE